MNAFHLTVRDWPYSGSCEEKDIRVRPPCFEKMLEFIRSQVKLKVYVPTTLLLKERWKQAVRRFLFHFDVCVCVGGVHASTQKPEVSSTAIFPTCYLFETDFHTELGAHGLTRLGGQ